mgnify:CR=1 FL=1
MLTTHILIPTHQRPQLMKRLLTSLQDCKSELSEVTIHIIENGSFVSKDICADFSELPLSYHHYEEGNKSKALNAVIDKLPVDSFLVFFDDDIKVQSGVVSDFIEAGKKNGKQCFYGGPLRADYVQDPDRGFIPYLPFSAKDFDLSTGDKYRKFDQFQDFLGANWACFLQDLTNVGGFSGKFGPGSPTGARGQETDAMLRMYQNGCTPVFITGAWVDHHVPEFMVQREWIVDRIFHASMHRGRMRPNMAHTLVMLTKLIFSSLLLPLSPNSIGHQYRINKAAGYFYGMVKRFVADR